MTRLRLVWTVPLFLAILLAQSPVCTAQRNGSEAEGYSLVRSFMRVLQAPSPPTLADYYYFEGTASENEAAFVLVECERRGWIPPLDNPGCLGFIKQRQQEPSKTISLYLSWLRRRLPPAGTVVVHSVKVMPSEYFGRTVIVASIGDASVTFFNPGSQVGAPAFGVLGIESIDGVPIARLIDEAIEAETRGRQPERRK